MRFQDLSQNSICSRLMKLSLPIESLLQMALILFSIMFLAFLRQMRISVKVITLSLCTQQQLLNSPFFFISFITFFIWFLDKRGKFSCLKFYSSWMNSTSLLSSRINRQMISQFTPSSIGIPLYFLSPTVEMYLSGSMVDGQMQFKNPTKSIFSLYPYSPNSILTSSSVLTILFSSSICSVCLRVMSPSPREMQLKSARGWKSGRVVMDSRQACRMFYCCYISVKQEQMLLKISPSFSQAFLERLSRFITTILYYNTLIISYQPEIMNRKCVVIINADDYGCSSSIDEGIMHLAKHKVINSLSVMVNGKNIEAAAQQVRDLWGNNQYFQLGLSVGLHFNITEGKPLCTAIAHSVLVQNGQFIGKPKIYQVIEEQDASLAQLVSQELTAQVDRFVQLFGRKPSHLDGHNHIHIVPNIAQPVAQTMRRLGIYRTRIPEQRLEKVTLPINHMFIMYSSQSKIHYIKEGILFTREFVGLQSFGNHSASLLRNAIARQQQHSNVSVELMCHPGFPANQGSQWVKSKDRLRQMQQLSSQQYSQLCGKQNYYGLVVACQEQR